MLKICNMKVEDAETVATMVALDHDDDLEKGYREALEHTLEHLEKHQLTIRGRSISGCINNERLRKFLD